MTEQERILQMLSQVSQPDRVRLLRERIGCLKLYRYRAINGNELDALQNSYLWFSFIGDLNDLYEGAIKLQKGYPDGNLELAIQMTITRNGGKPEVEERVFEMNNVIHQSNEYLKWNNELKAARTKICCFSKDNTNKLMWAHYADQNKGMVLEFDVTYDLDCFATAIPVLYFDEMQEIDFMRSSRNPMVDILRTKSREWERENEVRILYCDHRSNSPHKKSYNPLSLRSVIFGCRTSQDDVEKVKTALKNSEHVQFLRTRKSNENYNLLIVPES